MQSIYKIYSFAAKYHDVSKLLWIYQSIPCTGTIANFANKYSENLNWISYLNIIFELPSWSISELVLDMHQNVMRQHDFAALKIRSYRYTFKKQYKCRIYIHNLLFCFSKYKKLRVQLKISKNKSNYNLKQLFIL